MRFKASFNEVIGPVATVFLLGGMFVCARGWLDGRWMMLFIGLPGIVVVITEVRRGSRKRLFSVFIVFGALMLVTAIFGDWLIQKQWLRQHQWIEPFAVILFFLLFVTFVINRR